MKSNCRGCNKVFGGVEAFDMHRTDPYMPRGSRRCMTDEEMLSKGLHQSKKGWWVRTYRKKAIVAWGGKAA